MSTIFTYGRPGSGKTTLACSMTKLGYKVVILDIDQKADKMLNIRPLIEAGKVEVIPIDVKLTESNMRTRILTPAQAIVKQPQGYLKICDAITGFEKEISDGAAQRDEVLVIDSLTSMIEHMKRLISNIQRKDKFTFDEWGILLGNLEDFFYTVMNLQKLFKHVIVIAHEMVEKDEDSGRIISILPAIEGSMRNKVSKYFEEVYRLNVVNKMGKLTYQVATAPYLQAEARTTRDLNVIEEADFSVLFKEEINDRK